MKNKIVAVDVDDVLADLHREWILRYNRDFNDTLTVEDMKTWKISEAVKPEAVPRIFEYLKDKDLYDAIVPIQGAKEGVRVLKEMGFRVVYATACVEGMADQKVNWLVEHGFLYEKDPWSKAVGLYGDFVMAGDKSLVHADYLIDDREDYVRNFVAGTGILFDRPCNRHVDYPYVIPGWKDIDHYMVRLQLEEIQGRNTWTTVH
jgi:5'(3')-deoxyribonucleotidase